MKCVTAAVLSQNINMEVEMGTNKSDNSCLSQINSLVVAARARYSASADERETVVYFFAFHDTRDSPRKMQKPVVDLRVSKHEPQSALEKARNCKLEDF